MQLCQHQHVALPGVCNVSKPLYARSYTVGLRSNCLPHRVLRLRRQVSRLQTKAESSSEPSTPLASTSENASPPDRRGLLAGAAVVLGVAGFLATRSGQGAPSFASLEKNSIDLDTALANGKPTIIEFYAAWCGICRELLPVSAEVQSSFKGKVNFVALNIDNTKWTEEVSHYRVRGVPHFAFLDKHGKQQAAAVGRVPQQVLEDNARALATGSQMPYARTAGTISTPDNVSGTALRQVMPRDHA